MANEGNKRYKGDGKGRQGGRQKGTPNKMTKERRELISKFLDESFEDFKLAFSKITDPYKKCCIYTDLIPFTTPKLQSIELKEEGVRKSFEDELDELDGDSAPRKK